VKLTISKDQLEYGLSVVCGVIGSKIVMPVLGNVLLNAEGDRLLLTASNLEVTTICQVPCQVQEQGLITLPAKRLLQIVGRLEGEINIEQDKTKATLQSGRSFFKLAGLDAAEFPVIDIEPGTTVIAQQKAVFEALQSTEFAVLKDNSRPELQGVWFKLKEGAFFGTDGKRISRANAGITGDIDFTLPIRAASELRRILQDQGEVEISIAKGGNLAMFVADKTILVAKLLEDKFPKVVAQVVERDHPVKLQINRKELLGMIERVGSVSSQSTQKLRLDLEKGKLRASARSPEFGEANEFIEVQYAGQTLAIAFNPDYLVDGLSGTEAETVTVSFIDDLSPIKIEAENYSHIIMSMRID
jgi:DNA polymerase-3 subunit beta